MIHQWRRVSARPVSDLSSQQTRSCYRVIHTAKPPAGSSLVPIKICAPSGTGAICLVAAVLLPGAAGQDQVAAVPRIFRPAANKAAIQALICRGDKKGVGGKIPGLRNDIYGTPQRFQRAIILQQVSQRSVCL